MGINESDIEGHLAGALSQQDPERGEVADFLVSLDAAYPVESVAALADRHVPALAREARLVNGGQHLSTRRTMKDIFALRTHRALIATVAAALLVLTAGVGVASALGVNPLSHFAPASDPTITPVPTISPESPAAPTAEPTDDDSDDQADDQADDNGGATPTTTPTRTHEAEDANDSEDANDDTSDKAGDKADDQGDDDSEDTVKDKSGSGDQAGHDNDGGDHGGSGDQGDSAGDHGEDDNGDNSSEG